MYAKGGKPRLFDIYVGHQENTSEEAAGWKTGLDSSFQKEEKRSG